MSDETKLRTNARVAAIQAGFHSVRDFIIWCLEGLLAGDKRFRKDKK